MEKYRLVQEHRGLTAAAAAAAISASVGVGVGAGACASSGDQAVVATSQQRDRTTTPPSTPSFDGTATAGPGCGDAVSSGVAAGATASGKEGGSSSLYPEVRITQQGKPRNYISYAMNLFAEGSSTVVLKAMGRAINKAVTIAEILKRKMPLHQWNVLSSIEMIDIYEPVEEGLDVVTSRRYVSCMKIILSLSLLRHEISKLGDDDYDANRVGGGGSVPCDDEDEILDADHSGYQPPLPDEEIRPGDYHPSSTSSSPSPQQQQQQHLISTA